MIDLATILNDVIVEIIAYAVIYIVFVVIYFFYRHSISLKKRFTKTNWAKFKMFFGILMWMALITFILIFFSIMMSFLFYRTDFTKWNLVTSAINIASSKSLILTIILTIIGGSLRRNKDDFMKDIREWSIIYVVFTIIFSYIQITHDYRKYSVLPNYQSDPSSINIDDNNAIKSNE